MKNLILPSLILLAMIGKSAQADECSDASATPQPVASTMIALDRPPSRYEIAVANARQLDKSPLDKNSLDILMSLVMEFDDELRRLGESVKSIECTRTIIIEKLPEPAPKKDQIRTTFLRRKVEK